MTAHSPLIADRSGVYRMPDDAGKLREAAASAGFAWLDVDFSHVHDKAAALRTFASALAFPKSFGHNWDALADSLQDLSWKPAGGYVVSLAETHAIRGRGEDWRALLDILGETCSFWRGRGRVFIAFVEDPEVPQWK